MPLPWSLAARCYAEISPAPMTTPPSAFAQIGQIASQRAVHAALGWLHLHEQQIMRWQAECVAIPAPPFAEARRAAWLRERFAELGLADVHIDDAGNVLGSLRALAGEQALFENSVEPPPSAVILLSAHIDTVFPSDTRLAPSVAGTRLEAPGACDNGAGLAGMLAIAAALRHAAIEPPCHILFVGNVGEEGEGDLRGTRHIYAHAPWRSRIAAHLVLDGAGQAVAVTAALGSRRFEVALAGAGGHSWTAAGRPHPIVALSDAITRLHTRQSALSSSRDSPRDDPSEPAGEAANLGERLPRTSSSGRSRSRSTWSVGTIEGGSAINSIPASAVGRFDLRSTDADELLRLEAELHRAVEDAVLAANFGAPPEHALRSTISGIGDRPAGSLPPDARILALLRAVDRHLGLRTEPRTASTDANIPLSLGVEAISIGAGGEGGGIHTTGEWFDARGRDLGLRRILLLLLALADCHGSGHGSAHSPVTPPD